MLVYMSGLGAGGTRGIISSSGGAVRDGIVSCGGGRSRNLAKSVNLRKAVGVVAGEREPSAVGKLL